MIDLPDTDHLYFGWWLKEPVDSDGSYAFRTFSGGTVPFAVGQKFTSGNNDGLLGTASYRGRAAGRYVTKDFTGGVLSGGTAGVFTATATLAANFGGDDIAVNDQFNIRGSVTEFMDVGSGTPLEGWSVTLNTVDLAPDSASFGGTADDTTTATLGGVTGMGTWEGPSSATPGPTASRTPLRVCSTLIYPPRILPVGSAPPTRPRMNKQFDNDRFADFRRAMHDGYRDLVAGQA